MVDPAQTLDSEQLLEWIVALKAQAKAIDEQLTAALAQLTHLVDECEIDQAFKFNDWAFSCTSRTSYEYPQAVREIEGILKTARKASEADGSATAKVGTPFWTIRSPKP
jgi:hypothetical protein